MCFHRQWYRWPQHTRACTRLGCMYSQPSKAVVAARNFIAAVSPAAIACEIGSGSAHTPTASSPQEANNASCRQAGRQAGWRKAVRGDQYSTSIPQWCLLGQACGISQQQSYECTHFGAKVLFSMAPIIFKRLLEGLVLYACFAITNLQLHGTE